MPDLLSLGQRISSAIAEVIPGLQQPRASPCSHCKAVPTRSPGCGHELDCPVWMTLFENGELSQRSQQAHDLNLENFLRGANTQASQAPQRVSEERHITFAGIPDESDVIDQPKPVPLPPRRSSTRHAKTAKNGPRLVIAQCELQHTRVGKFMPQANYLLSGDICKDIEDGLFDAVLDKGNV